MPVAEIITIGTELLLGEIQDTNTSYIAKTLNASGIDVYHASIIGDNEDRIAKEIQLALQRADIIITTGGLGPTVDDPTRKAVALAFNQDTVFRPELWDQVLARFKAYGREPSENNRRQAFIPMGAVAIANPVGTAPAFYFEEETKIVFSLPGVPSEMKTLLINEVLPIIKTKYNFQSTLVIRTIHTAGIGESSVDELISDLEKMRNPTVGLAAHPGQVDIRITAKANNTEEAWLLIRPVEMQVKQLLGNAIYGEDEKTLESVVSDLLHSKSVEICLNYDSESEEIASLISGWLNLPAEKMKALCIKPGKHAEGLLYNPVNAKDFILNLTRPQNSENGLIIEIFFQEINFNKTINYGGHPSQRNRWAGNHILNLIREILLPRKGAK